MPVTISIPELKKIIYFDESGKCFIQCEYDRYQIDLILSGIGITKTRTFVTLNNLETEIIFLSEVQKIKGGFAHIWWTGFPYASKKSLTVEKIKNVPFVFGINITRNWKKQ